MDLEKILEAEANEKKLNQSLTLWQLICWEKKK